MSLFSKKSASVPRRRTGDVQTRPTQEELGERYTFRRNRTLTGSASSQVTSPNEKGADLKSPRVQAHELAQKRRHLGVIFSLALVGALGTLFLISQFTAKAIVVSAEDVTTQLDPVYEKTIQEYFANQPVERLRFVLDEAQLTRFVQVVSPEVAEVSVDGSAGMGASRFQLTMREPIAGWNINGKQKYVDGSGTAFTRNYFRSPGVQIVDRSGIQVETGQAVASNRFLGFVGRVVGLSKAEGYAVSRVIIPRSTTRQIEVRLKDVSFPVKFSVDRAAGEQIEDMTRAFTWMKRHKVAPRYIDVRVSNKVFYR